MEIHNAFVNPDEGLPVEMDEMWSYYHDKSHQVWLWWAIDHNTGVPVAFVFGTREYKYLDELLELLKKSRLAHGVQKAVITAFIGAVYPGFWPKFANSRTGYRISYFLVEISCP